MINKKNIHIDFIGDITKTILDFDMLEKGDAVLTAVSGGPDSVALVLSLLAIHKKYDLKIGIAHMNHMLRGEESQRDETFTKALAKELSLPFYGEQIDVKEYADTHRLSLEEAGREVRYHFLNQIAKNHDYTKIATGHNKNDNAELVLMNLLRGSGPKGLSGIPPVRNKKYIRPLIQMPKDKIINFLKAAKRPYMFDSSNTDTTFLRNKIRHTLVPQLQSEYNPEIIDSLDRLSHILKLEDDYLNKETKKQFTYCLIESDHTHVLLSKSKLESFPTALLYRVIRKAIKQVKTDLKRISYAHMNDIVEFCFDNPTGLSIDLPGQIRVYKIKDTILIQKENKPLRVIEKKEKQLRQMA
ncbi:MAG: tRNA lysidine(34) synthetase TilS, partial [Desulfobacteraceae bacterium]|nr:tRNA lysidine(34) synthetase TilS [Desulfobacteraceae bacterium]